MSRKILWIGLLTWSNQILWILARLFPPFLDDQTSLAFSLQVSPLLVKTSLVHVLFLILLVNLFKDVYLSKYLSGPVRTKAALLSEGMNGFSH